MDGWVGGWLAEHWPRPQLTLPPLDSPYINSTISPRSMNHHFNNSKTTKVSQNQTQSQWKFKPPFL